VLNKPQFAVALIEGEAMTSRSKTRSGVAALIARRIQETGKPQKELAAACGWPKPNVVTMIKQGITKVPLDKVGLLARALELDPASLFWMVIAEYHPDSFRVIAETVPGLLMDDNEVMLIEVYRDMTRGRVVRNVYVDGPAATITVEFAPDAS
jgi:hypothetical protein